jgi:pimeloyl-ACP methyl ester carboxylesterase
MSYLNCTLYNMTNHDSGTQFAEPITGTTGNGVPFLAIPPMSDPASAPIVVLWHLMDPPRTEAAFAAALPLDGLDAWKLYLGLPGFGPRAPGGGMDAMFANLMVDAPGLVHGPTHVQAADEFPAAFADLRERLGLGADAPVGLVGGSMGSAVAAEVLTRGTSAARTAVFVSPMLDLRAMIDAVSPAFGGYEWTEPGTEAATRLDYVTRADEVAAAGASIRVIVGADDAPFMAEPAKRVAEAIGADVQVIPGMEHALAEEPGIEPAPQTEAARQVDPLAVEWLRLGLA